MSLANCEREKLLLMAQGLHPADHISPDCWETYYKDAWGGADIDPKDLTTFGPDTEDDLGDEDIGPID